MHLCSPESLSLFFAALNGNEEHWEAPVVMRPDEKPCLPSVSSALVLGTLLGLGEAFILTVLAGPILTAMGVNAVSLSCYLLSYLYTYECFLRCPW